MRRLLLAAAAAALVPAVVVPLHSSLAQGANRAQVETITEIAQCMAQGLPDDWVTAYLIVDLAKPGDSTGKVRYLVARKSTEASPEPFTPCDTDRPPVALIGLRMLEPAERRGWTSARLILERDGNFRLNYDFPK